jgi:hypothetical protein
MNWEDQKRVLKEMGYNNYREYLAGIVWAKIREKVMELHKNRCTVCSRKSTVIHHREYNENVLRGIDITSLEPLCWECHRRIEYDEYGNKNELSHANRKLDWFKRNKHIWMKHRWASINIQVEKERRRYKSPLLEV